MTWEYLVRLRKRAFILVCRSNADRTAGVVCDAREATDVMEDLWPCEVCLQGPTSNHPERHWLKTVVVSVGGKGRSNKICQVRIEKTSTSESPFRRRKSVDDIKTRGQEYPWDESIGEPAYWVDDVRRRGGVSSIRAHPWNCGNSGCDAKRKDQVKKSKVESIEARSEDGPACISVEGLVMSVERRGRVVPVQTCVNSLGRMSA
jgi:hypothetical protein